LGNVFYEQVIATGATVDYTDPTGKIFYAIWSMRLDKEFYTHLAQYQATINAEKIDDAFNLFKKAVYPHLEKIEERRKKELKIKLEKEMKDDVMKVTPLMISARDIQNYNRQLKARGSVTKNDPISKLRGN
jgi:Zn-dependent M32 family carboxypeptidase